MSARARKKPLLVMPPLHCQIAGCGAEYATIGDYADTHRAAELGGWRYCIFDDDGRRLIGAWVCPDHRHVLPWWPGRRLALPLPVREPGATRAEVIGVVPRDVSWSTAALPAPEPDLEPLPQRKPAGPPGYMCQWCAEVAVPAPGLCEECQQNDDAVEFKATHDANCLCMAEQDEPQPGGTIYPELTPQALAGGVPLATLAPEQEDEVKR